MNTSAQNKHIEGTQKYNNRIAKGEHPSTLSIDRKEQKEVISRYLKEGMPEMRNNGSTRIRFTHDKEIGTARSRDGNEKEKTRSGVLHTGKDRIHIVPMFEKKE